MINKTLYSLKDNNSFHLDVICDKYLEYSSVKELKELISSSKIGDRFLNIGSGSNLLFSDDYHGTVLHSAINFIKIKDETRNHVIVKVGAACIWDDFVKYCCKHKWYGCENLSLVPGETGSAAVQNIGAYGKEIKDLLIKVNAIDLITGKECSFDVDECNYGYRTSIFKTPEMRKYAITAVTFRLLKYKVFTLSYKGLVDELKRITKAKTPISLSLVREAIINIRNRKLPDPKIIGNAGSFFTNPSVSKEKLEELKKTYPDIPFYGNMITGLVKLSAGWLIEQCGWKGHDIGKAGVYEHQALILVNRGGATGKNLIDLSEKIQETVKEKFGIILNREVNIINN
ncbi:MAG: UDP-N-acetylmuramate dehydrogenase [Bacteroidales bacterium]